jgi:hypothetical protein
MSVTSELEIFNLALSRIGQETLASTDERGKPGNLCRLHYPLLRDAVLRAHPWNFAVRRVELAEVADYTPPFEFDRAFALPTEPYCLKVIRTDWEATGWSSAAIYGFPGVHGMYPMTINYRIETIRVNSADLRVILCNEATMKIEYIARITDVAQWDALFVEAMVSRLAAELAMPLADNATLAKNMLDTYMAKLSEARLVDAQEGTPREVVNTDGWVLARQ